jgi:hypothetical protein
MKPLPAASLTDDDMMIWRRVCGLAGYHAYFRLGCLEMKGQRADRRDAELMLRIEQVRACAEFKLEHIVYMLLRGWLYCDTIGIAKV